MNFLDPTVYQNKYLLLTNSLGVSKKEKTDSMHASILILSSVWDFFFIFNLIRNW